MTYIWQGITCYFWGFQNLAILSRGSGLSHQHCYRSKYLFQFNFVIRFCLGHLGIKPDTFTRQWDVYLKKGNTSYTTVNSHNFKPIFTQEQLAASVWATVLLFSFLCATTVVDLDTLHQDILLVLSSNPTTTKHIPIDGWWSTNFNGLLCLDDRIYILSAGNLHIYILQYNHDHILSSHFSQNKTLELVCCRYS